MFNRVWPKNSSEIILKHLRICKQDNFQRFELGLIAHCMYFVYFFVVMIKLRDGYQMLAAICKMVDHNKQPVPHPGYYECSFVNTLQYRHWKLSFVTHFRHNNIFISGWLTIPTAGPSQATAFLTNNLLSQKCYLKSKVLCFITILHLLKVIAICEHISIKIFQLWPPLKWR